MHLAADMSHVSPSHVRARPFSPYQAAERNVKQAGPGRVNELRPRGDGKEKVDGKTTAVSGFSIFHRFNGGSL
jgi:hypothetical protein